MNEPTVHEIWVAQRKLAHKCICDECFREYLDSIYPTYTALRREAVSPHGEKVA